jgi:hypothetical protein
MYAAFIAAVAMFPSPSVAMAAFLILIQNLEAAQTAAKAGKGLAAARNAKRDLLWTAMESLRVYVQGLSDELSVENAIALIHAAGLVVAHTGAHPKAVLEAKYVATTGLVELFANASILGGKTKKRMVFHWQWSSDGSKTWNNVTSTPLAQTTIANLGPGIYAFRVSVTVSKTLSPWSQAVSLTIR